MADLDKLFVRIKASPASFQGTEESVYAHVRAFERIKIKKLENFAARNKIGSVGKTQNRKDKARTLVCRLPFSRWGSRTVSLL